MFLTSVINTHLNYNRKPFRDWALAGGVTSTSATFRVRGPKSDDGIKRQFVVSTNPNLALERDMILVTPVSYGDFTAKEHLMKRVSIGGLTPLRTYYYGITRPHSTPDSATMAGDVGKFRTPAKEGSRMNFTIATGSCSLTGSTSEMFTSVLDLDPLIFIHAGDFHYEDLETLDVDKRLEAYDKVMGSASQRLLYMRTIFAYIWDDHDWLGNNEDSEDGEASNVAKEGYTLGIPHYPLGAIEAGTTTDEGTAAKYQAFTVGTVRFIISDLRSESIKSTENFVGQMYSTEQKDWLYNELSQAMNYDFVVWVTSRPWTDPDEVGSDSWGGFVQDRDELSAVIASTVGAGPKNLLVLSGDTHMLAFDDGSSTDYSGLNETGGFPLLHSGPLTNFGSGLKDFITPQTNYYTDGCMAINSEVNHQFSALKFVFPSEEDEANGVLPCIEIKGYADSSENFIFEKQLCGEIMREGTPKQDTCTLPRLSQTTTIIFIFGLCLIGLNLVLALWYLGLKRCLLALSYFGIGVLFYFATVAAAATGALCFGTLGVNVLAVSIFTLAQAFVGTLFVGLALHCYYTDCKADTNEDSATRKAEDDAGSADAPLMNKKASDETSTEEEKKDEGIGLEVARDHGSVSVYSM